MSQLYRRHQSRGLRPKQVTLIRQRCPVTGQLLGPNEGNTVAVEHLDRDNPRTGRFMSLRIARLSMSQWWKWINWRKANNVQIVV